MKKEIKPPIVEEDKLQAIIDFLVDNGMSEFQVNMFIHTNIPALGGDTTIMNCVQEGRWGEAWSVAKAYIDGDYF